MKGMFPQTIAAAVLAVVVHTSAAAQTGVAAQTNPPADPKPRPDLVTQPYNQADVDFVSGMIPRPCNSSAIGIRTGNSPRT